ncbi:MAG: MerR family transcriptional regulator [Leucobacter sp.]
MRIGALSSQSGVSVRSLRYYEQQGLLDTQRTASGQRTYTSEHLAIVVQIQELFDAGFCSSVIRALLPVMDAPTEAARHLGAEFDEAEARLRSEKQAIDAELSALARLRCRFGLAPNTRVTLQDGDYDYFGTTPATTFDHRDRRLR